MSIKALGWAWKQVVSPVEKLTLLALADHADDDGRSCYPSKRRLAEKTGLTERAIQNITARLEEAGLIHETARYENRRQTSNNYRLFLTKKTGEGEHGSPSQGRTAFTGGAKMEPSPGVHGVRPRGRTGSTPDEPSEGTVIEPAFNRAATPQQRRVKISNAIEDLHDTLQKPNLSDLQIEQIKGEIRRQERLLEEVEA